MTFDIVNSVSTASSQGSAMRINYTYFIQVLKYIVTAFWTNTWTYNRNKLLITIYINAFVKKGIWTSEKREISISNFFN